MRRWKQLSRIKRFHLLHLLFWLVPGAILSYILRNSIPWVNFMSWYAIVTGAFGAWRADEPINEERR